MFRVTALRILFVLAALGLLAGLVAAWLTTRVPKPQAPVFDPSPNPYPAGIYATGIVESRQSHGANVVIFPEVSGPITGVLVNEGDVVSAGEPLVTIDDSPQRETTNQQRAQIAVVEAQIANARATLKVSSDTLAKYESAVAVQPGAVSRDLLDTTRNTVRVAETSLRVAERQHEAQIRAAAAAEAVLEEYTIRAPSDGVVLSIGAATGSYVSPQGAFDPYTQGFVPLVVMASAGDELEVRCYVDEILISRLPKPSEMVARMQVRGTDVSVPLRYERMQPYVSPKIQLTDQRQERVDVRVLPLIFSFDKPSELTLYPGQLVDVYIGT